jgi:hypothetical protein
MKCNFIIAHSFMSIILISFEYFINNLKFLCLTNRYSELSVDYIFHSKILSIVNMCENININALLLSSMYWISPESIIGILLTSFSFGLTMSRRIKVVKNTHFIQAWASQLKSHQYSIPTTTNIKITRNMSIYGLWLLCDMKIIFYTSLNLSFIIDLFRLLSLELVAFEIIKRKEEIIVLKWVWFLL